MRCACSLCMALSHALLFVCTSFSCLYRDLHVFRRSSRKVCSSRSMAGGGARPYLRSASIEIEGEEGSDRTCARPRAGWTPRERGAVSPGHDVQRDSLDVCFVRFVQPAESHFVAYFELVRAVPVGRRKSLCPVPLSLPLRCPSPGET